jgi:hypothetical protein
METRRRTVISAFKRFPQLGLGTADLEELVHMRRRDERIGTAREEEDWDRLQARHDAGRVPYLVSVGPKGLSVSGHSSAGEKRLTEGRGMVSQKA